MSRAVTAILAVAMLLLPASAGAATKPSKPPASVMDAAPRATDRVIVRWRDESSGPAREQARDLIRLKVFADRSTAVLDTDGRNVDAILADLRADPAVEWAEPDYQVSLLVDEQGAGEVAAITTDDPRLGEQYALERMRVRDAWTLTKGGTHVVAVLDTGIQWIHPELVGRVAINPGESGSGRESNGEDDDDNGYVDDFRGWDFVGDDRDPRDDNDHGTWVSGIIAATPNNGIGIAGISWTNRVLPVKVMNASGLGWTSDLALGIDYAANRGAKVINMSVGGFPSAQVVAEAVARAWDRGVVLVAAAGNARSSVPSYPAAFRHVISVSATQADDELTNWTNYGTSVDLSAPGAAITHSRRSRWS